MSRLCHDLKKKVDEEYDFIMNRFRRFNSLRARLYQLRFNMAPENIRMKAYSITLRLLYKFMEVSQDKKLLSEFNLNLTRFPLKFSEYAEESLCKFGLSLKEKIESYYRKRYLNVIVVTYENLYFNKAPLLMDIPKYTTETDLSLLIDFLETFIVVYANVKRGPYKTSRSGRKDRRGRPRIHKEDKEVSYTRDQMNSFHFLFAQNAEYMIETHGRAPYLFVKNIKKALSSR